MKKIVVISDSFKGTLSSREICEIARGAAARILPGCKLDAIPAADGGEGTVDCFLASSGAQPVTVCVSGPFGEKENAIYARKGTLAVVETASAAGFSSAHRDPSAATTFGVGELIRHAVGHGCTEILLGLGGSCTNDGGCGCAAAMGTRFTDSSGEEFVPVGGTLDRIAHIDVSQTRQLLDGVTVTLMSDVDNPLCGEFGAARVFGPQKGADAETAARLDANLGILAARIESELGISVADVPGAGAAGGMGAGCMAFLGARMRSGIETVLDSIGFDALLDGAELVITGEGRVDGQSAGGKLISGVARRTRRRGIPLVAIAGCIMPDAAALYDLGVTAMFGIDREARDLEDYAPRSAELYRATLEDVLRFAAATIN